ncbi:MAG: arginyltransferase [Alphaproteobacteria bacterium]
MTSHSAKLPRFFYRMPPRPCPYLPGRTEQNIFTELAGPNTTQLYDALTQAGFRRSHNVAYRPACPTCQACVAVRVATREFAGTPNLRRVARRNFDVEETEAVALATVEQYRLFSAYVNSRHGDGEMAGMSFSDYAAMVQDSPLRTFVTEYRDGEDRLVAACLVDKLGDGLSAVYSFFDPRETGRSLGTYMILKLIEKTRALGLPYLYLGYWINGSQKMSYKARFRPLEGLGAEGWAVLPED